MIKSTLNFKSFTSDKSIQINCYTGDVLAFQLIKDIKYDEWEIFNQGGVLPTYYLKKQAPFDTVYLYRDLNLIGDEKQIKETAQEIWNKFISLIQIDQQ